MISGMRIFPVTFAGDHSATMLEFIAMTFLSLLPGIVARMQEFIEDVGLK
jgi:hypothetical protein